VTKPVPLAAPRIGAEERSAVDAVLRSGMLTQGPETRAFESEFSATVADRPCVAVNSGTSALLLALKALGIGPGDEVILPSFTFAATANAVVLAGAVPVFADIEPDTFTLAPNGLSSAITSRTAAVLPVHLYGHPADMTALSRVARRHSLAIVEDAAQAHLAMIGGLPVGTLGDAAAFSFYPTKNMTTGEGGMVVTNSEETARIARLLRNQGMEQRYRNEIVGYNMRMTDIHAAIGRVQLRSLKTWTERRRRNAAVLANALRGVEVPIERSDAQHVYHQFTIRVPGGRRDALSSALSEAGIGNAVYYPVPVHLLPAYGRENLDLPETNRATHEVLSIPVHPSLSRNDLRRVVAEINRFTGAG